MQRRGHEDSGDGRRGRFGGHARTSTYLGLDQLLLLRVHLTQLPHGRERVFVRGPSVPLLHLQQLQVMLYASRVSFFAEEQARQMDSTLESVGVTGTANAQQAAPREFVQFQS